MNKITVLDHHVVYDNPIPNLLSRHGYFPGLVQLTSGELLGLFCMGQAFESALKVYVTRSNDNGKSWQLQGPVYDDSADSPPNMDSLKPLLLNDGTLIAAGYRFYRPDPEVLINPETGGIPHGENIISFSKDQGHTWTVPEKINLDCPEILELSGPCIECANGQVAGIAAAFPMWDGSQPSGHVGFFFKSPDKGKTWSKTVYFQTPKDNIKPYESRICEMQPGRLVALVWALDEEAGASLPNMCVVSHDNGTTWSDPIDTGVPAQASNLIHLGGEKLLTIHCHREGDPIGLYVRIIDFTNDKWKIVDEVKVWGGATAQKVTDLSVMGTALKFGQGSLLALDNGEILACHWSIEQNQGRVLAHRLKLE